MGGPSQLITVTVWLCLLGEVVILCIIDLPDNAATTCKFEEVFAKIAALGTDILHPSLVSKTHGHHGNLIAAYKNLMSIGMKIQHAEIWENVLKTEIQLKIKDFLK